MDALSAIKVRLNAAKGLIARERPGVKRRAISAIHKDAVLGQFPEMTIRSDQKALLLDAVASTGFEKPDELEIISALSRAENADLQQNSAGRRKMQKGFAFLNFLSNEEWNHVGSLDGNIDECLEVFVGVLYDRCGIVNATEPTKKWATSAAIAAAFPDKKWQHITQALKHEYKFKCNEKLVQRYQSGSRMPPEYIIELPKTLGEIEVKYPKTFAKIVSEIGNEPGPWGIDIAVVGMIDRSFNCRGGKATVGANQQVAVPDVGGRDMFMQMMQSCMMQMQMNMQNMARGDADIPGLTINGRGKKGLKTLADLCEQNPSGAASSQGMRRARTLNLEDLGGSDAEAEVERQAPLQIADAPRQESPSQGDGQPLDLEVSPHVLELASKKRKARDLCEALIERDAERALENKQKKAAEKAEAKAAALAKAAAEAHAEAKPAEAKPEAKAASKGGSPAKPKATAKRGDRVKNGKGCGAKKKGNGLSPGQSPKIFKAKPSWSNEHSRSQILCRTGLRGPGQSHNIKYGPLEGITVPEAIEMAKEWIKNLS